MYVTLNLCRTALFVGALVSCLSGCAAPMAQLAPSASLGTADERIERELALATFDSAWSRIHHTYYDPTFRGLDWAGVRQELRPRVEAVTTTRELRRVINEMLDRIGDSHFALIPQESADALDPEAPRAEAGGMGDPGLEVRVVEGQVLVSRVEPGSPAEQTGVRAGWIVEAVGERQTARWLEALAQMSGEPEQITAKVEIVARVAALLRGDPGSTVPVRFLDGQDRPVTLDLARRHTPGEPVRFGNLPTFLAALEHERLEGEGGCVGVIRFNIWMPSIGAPFEQAMQELRDCAGIVLDLRGNPGGVGGMVMGIAGYVLEEVVPLGVMKTRQGELRFVSNPRRADSAGRPVRPYAGRLAILTDPMSMSTSEVFAAGMQGIGRARVFGETSGGQALPAMMVRLPNQDMLLHAIADFTAPDGTRIEGRGVVPDEQLPLRREQLLAGRDAPLEAAVRWIRDRRETTAESH